jgi:monovalent cation:proton antiporter-2 (CPA2) family protein
MLLEILLFLAAAVVLVPLFKFAGLGPILGYLAAGVLIGPFDLGFDKSDVLHFSELGVVLLLFLIGLELKPARLWALRRSVFGLGLPQMALTAAALSGALLVLDVETNAALILGFSFALSSTAFGLQLLAEKSELTTRHGRSAFSILLFQDVAVAPAIAISPLLGHTVSSNSLDLWSVLIDVAAVVCVLVGGRYALRFGFRVVADSRVGEVFTALALLIVLGTGLLLQWLGLSMALGAFIAGVILADSEYRHALEAELQPFKGLLLGLFFIAVGMTLDLNALIERPFLIAALTVALVAIKGTVLFTLGRLHGLRWQSALALSAAVSQGGEFAFVLLALATAAGLLQTQIADVAVLVVGLSMFTTPLLYRAVEWVRSERDTTQPPIPEFDPQSNAVIIAGFGRFGQIVGRILYSKNIPFSAIDVSPTQIEVVKHYGSNVYYGDVSRIDLLRAAGIEEARFLVVAVDDIEAAANTAALVKENFPRVQILARAHDRHHAYRLMDVGVDYLIRDTFLSSLDLTFNLLRRLGIAEKQSQRAVEAFRRADERLLYQHLDSYSDEQRARQLEIGADVELAELFAGDNEEHQAR